MRKRSTNYCDKMYRLDDGHLLPVHDAKHVVTFGAINLVHAEVAVILQVEAPVAILEDVCEPGFELGLVVRRRLVHPPVLACRERQVIRIGLIKIGHVSVSGMYKYRSSAVFGSGAARLVWSAVTVPPTHEALVMAGTETR